MRIPPLAVLFAGVTLSTAASYHTTAAPARSDLRAATSNDNRHGAGTLRGGVLTVSLASEVARWYPGPDSAPPVVTQMFGEEGKTPTNPGPLLRMPLGTRVNLTLRNTLPDSMFFAAACTRPCKTRDTLRLAPGATGQLSFTPAHAGTFAYWGVPIRGGKPVVNEEDASQLGGIIVVDSGKPVDDRDIFERQLRSALKYLSYASVIFVSALEATQKNSKGMARVLHEVLAVAAERRKRVTTGQMNRFLEKVDFQKASVPMNKRVRIYYMTQAAVAPPTFVLFTDKDIKMHFSFERFLANQIRENFGFIGSPIWFKIKARNKKKEA